jgi:hypothetical protein
MLQPIATHTINIQWNGEKYEVRIPELGTEIQAYTDTYEQAEMKGTEVIAQALAQERNAQHHARAS